MGLPMKILISVAEFLLAKKTVKVATSKAGQFIQHKLTGGHSQASASKSLSQRFVPSYGKITSLIAVLVGLYSFFKSDKKNTKDQESKSKKGEDSTIDQLKAFLHRLQSPSQASK
ncbi:unnamed protein product, partial [Mesorhabditis spiculigera]